MKTETRAIENFNQIKFRDFGKLILTQGDRVSLSIKADEELLTELISEVSDGVLTLGVADEWLNRVGKVISSMFSNAQRHVIYTLTFVDLEKISISGKCDLDCASMETDVLKIKVSGLGNLSFDYLDCDELAVMISGRGAFAAAGRADQQDVRISGSGDYQAPDLVSRSMRIAISGHGYATVKVSERLDITVSGMGQVDYYGHPKLRQVISGLGKSKRLNDG